MADLSKKVIFLLNILAQFLSLYGYIPFYPGVAGSQGIPTWLIGIIISSTPIISFLSSPFIPHLMEKFGRKSIIIAGSLAVTTGNLTISIIEYTPLPLSIFLSFTGRSIMGIGFACGLISAYATLTSDYPEEATKMFAWVEVAFGIGSVIGPSIGSVIFSELGYFYACLVFAISASINLLILLTIFGQMREYKILNIERLSLLELLSKKEIFLTSIIQICIPISLGFIVAVIEYHLKEYDIDSSELGMYYSISTFSYLFFSLLVAYVPGICNKPKIMLFGIVLLAISFAMIGPSHFIFPDKLIVVCFGLGTIGVSGAFGYIMSMPHMLETSVECYGYILDDRLNDALSGLTNLNVCLGEASGPIIGSLLYYFLGFENSSNIMCLFCMILAVIYGYFSDAFRKPKQFKYSN